MMFVPRNCLEQMTYSGVFEAVRIRKQGFPFRLGHMEFVARYKCIADKARTCQDIISQMKLNSDNVRMGATMVLYRAEEHKALELKRSIKVKTIEINEALKEITTTNVSKLSKAEKEEFLNKLARSVMQADEFRLKSAVAEKARDLLDSFIQARLDNDPECKRLLEQANASKDQGQLEKALEMADKRGYQACHYVRKTRDLCKQATEANDMLTVAKNELEMNSWNTQQLGEALANAASFQYQSMLVNECTQLKYRVDRITQEAALAVQTLDEPHVRAVVTAANELGMRDNNIQYFSDLVRGDYTRFLEAQYQKSVELKDHARAIRAYIKKKDILISKQGDEFTLKTYKNLKRADAWAKEKFFGNKQNLAMGFLKWQKKAIHSHMCTYNVDKKTLKMKKKMLVKGFKALQAYQAGTGKNTFPDLTMLLQQAQGDKTLRDELYVHAMKQVTQVSADCPYASQANDKGFEWLGILMNAFGPSPELENVVEAFVRKHDGKAGKYQLKGQLRRRMYEGDAKSLPSVGDVQDAGRFLSSKANGFDDPKPTGQETYKDIQQPYYELLRQYGIQPSARKAGQHTQAARAGQPASASVRAAQKRAKPVAAAAPAQSEWQAAKDPASGRTYYYNVGTGQTQWEKPAGF